MEDLAAFTAKMVRLSTDHELRKRMGEQARQASGFYAIERTSAIMLENYQRIVEKSSGRKRGLRARFERLLDRMRP